MLQKLNLGKLLLLSTASLSLVACGQTNQTNGIQGNTSASQTSQAAASLTAEKAEELAFADAGVAAADVTNKVTRQETEDGQQVFEIEWQSGTDRYEYTVSALDGSILDKSKEGASTGTTSGVASSAANTGTSSEAQLSSDEAKKIALQDAGLAETAVTNLTVELDQDLTSTAYEVSFDDLSKNLEYDYKIDAKSGEILERQEESAAD